MFINSVDTATEFEHCKRVKNVFQDILNCTRAAAAISVLVNELRNELKDHIPLLDKQFISHYATWANDFLQAWLQQITSSEEARNMQQSQSYNDTQDELSAGIGEHVDFLSHPFRPPFAWRRAQGNIFAQPGTYLLCTVRNMDNWMPPASAQTSLLLLFMAFSTEPVTVWIRDGSLAVVRATEEVLRKAEIHAGEDDNSVLYAAKLEEVHRIGLLYEDVMGMIGANIHSARPKFTIFRKAIELISQRFNAYTSCMEAFVSSKSFMCSPREFDDMLVWTGAVGTIRGQGDGESMTEPRSTEYILNEHGRSMRRLYTKMASSKSNEFLETGIWAPDFPTL